MLADLHVLISLSPAVLPIIVLVGLILLILFGFAVKAVPRGDAAEPLRRWR